MGLHGPAFRNVPRGCEAENGFRRVEVDDWQRLRDIRLRALTTDPKACLETAANARTFPDELWRERARPSDSNITFVHELDGAFDGMVSAFVADDPETAYLVGMWVAPELRGSGVASGLVECIIEWSRTQRRSRIVLSVEGDNGRAARLYEKCGFVELDEPPRLPYEPHPGNRFYDYRL
jgi:ribosomal protein S18 acetylase RimI-like enzyme